MPPPSALAIKTSSVLRFIKEESSYHKELNVAKSVYAHMRERDTDEYELKQQNTVIQQTKDMIPQVRKQLQTALEKLEVQLRETPVSEPVESREKAQKAIDDARKVLEDSELE